MVENDAAEAEHSGVEDRFRQRQPFIQLPAEIDQERGEPGGHRRLKGDAAGGHPAFRRFSGNPPPPLRGPPL